MAPIVAGLLAQGFDLLANAVMSKGREVVEEKLGVKLPENLAGQTPEVLAQLKQAEMVHQEWLLANALEETKTFLADTQDARKMQMTALEQDDLFSKRFIYYFAMGWSLFTVVYITVVSLTTIPQSSLRFVDTVLGFLLGTVVATILNFFFGTSRSSKAKDDTIAEVMRRVSR